MLAQFVSHHRGTTRCSRYELDFAETVRRHAGKPQAAEYGPDRMRGWWREADPLPGVPEEVIGAHVSLDDAVVRVLRSGGW